MIHICTECHKKFNSKNRSLRCSVRCLNKYRKRYFRERSIKYSNKIKLISKKWRIENPEKARKQSEKWRLNHPQKTKEIQNKWKNANREKIRKYDQKRRDLQRIDGHTLEEWETLKAQYNWICLCCKKQEPTIKLERDHIIPVIKGGSSNIQNIQPLCGSCNSKKHTKIIKYNY